MQAQSTNQAMNIVKTAHMLGSIRGHCGVPLARVEQGATSSPYEYKLTMYV